MYLGRIVSVGMTKNNRLCLMYRVSARSFPNRVIKNIKGALSVIPTPGSESDIYQNPYISYNCLRYNSEFAVVGNGTHTDPIFEKLISGMNMRDSLISVLFGMDYEHDDYSTPRIAAVTSKILKTSALGVIRDDGIEVAVFKLEPDTYRYLSTYERNHISQDYSGSGFDPSSSEDVSQFIIDQGEFSKFINPISSASAIETESGFEIGFNNVQKTSHPEPGT